MLADRAVASPFGNPLEICSKITGRVIDPPLQVWLVIWRAKQQFVVLTSGRYLVSCILYLVSYSSPSL